MPNVLVVDDSPIDRVLIEGLLKKDPRMRVRPAGSGADALEQIARQAPDVVVTDLQMPEMDGLQLVTALRIHYPRIPVLLITAHGSEELAVRALEQGAASYVPKSQLAANLLPAVDQVLELARDNHGYEALAEAMQYAEFRFQAKNDFATTDRLVELVRQLAASVGVCDTGGEVRLGMALEEAFRLVILRGNLELPADLLRAVAHHRDDTEGTLAQRAATAPYAGRKVRVHVQIAPAEARIELAHDGPPLAIHEAPPQSNPLLEDPLERSLILMRAFLDEVRFAPDGKSIVLVKRPGAQ
ncbi:MAG: response regulator [Pirellulaceae bacterium]|nr:response regulator [Pirellulaceae bacterium]